MATLPLKRYAPALANGDPPWMRLYTTNVAELASLEATLKLVMVNGAALDVLTKNVSLDTIAGWARVSRMFGALVFHSNTFWFAMMKRYVYIHHGQYMLYDFKRPYLEYAKHQLPAKFRTCIQLNRCVIWHDERPNWVSNETYAYWQIQTHASLYVFIQDLDARHIVKILSILDGNVFEQKCSFSFVCGPWQYHQPWSPGRIDGTHLTVRHVLNEISVHVRGGLLESALETDGVLQINFEYHVSPRL
jgi:hypothetical protein